MYKYLFFPTIDQNFSLKLKCRSIFKFHANLNSKDVNIKNTSPKTFKQFYIYVKNRISVPYHGLDSFSVF